MCHHFRGVGENVRVCARGRGKDKCSGLCASPPRPHTFPSWCSIDFLEGGRGGAGSVHRTVAVRLNGSCSKSSAGGGVKPSSCRFQNQGNYLSFHFTCCDVTDMRAWVALFWNALFALKFKHVAFEPYSCKAQHMSFYLFCIKEKTWSSISSKILSPAWHSKTESLNWISVILSCCWKQWKSIKNHLLIYFGY